MKKALLASAALWTFSALAQAQGSITLYGRLDAGLEYMTGVPTGVAPNGAATGSSHRFRAESGDWGTSLWGLKGVEDVGNGNHVVFQLEGSFNTMNGQGPGNNGIFNRWATVGLSNDRYGTLRIGRELFISNGLWDFDPFGQSAWSSASLVRGRNWPQSSNNVSWQSPNVAGFDFYGQYAFSNASSWNGNGTSPQGREAGAQITYTAPLFQVRGIYDEIRNPANGSLGGAYANGGNGVYAYSREYTALLNVFLGAFKLQGGYQAIRSSGMTGLQPGQPSALDQEWGGVTWQATPAAALIAAVYHVNGNNGAGNATLYSVGGTYKLSKRTLLDFQVATVQNSGSANYGLNANNVGNTAATDNPLPGQSQTGVYAGIQHSF
ncbi:MULTISPECIES: porin [unclassified Caballeronia]|uniref:porin n=1 Tax=unclassified Caballeronia TaxID=2646786 RepID=UPI002859A36D|nr:MULTISPECIES: porin [unclassified Caballeronia]MDR5812763.1 porin [Caballeronia sp. LZ033]MDR5819616.1 porin [Caballeronia sp. LZ043]MDR5877385.1 porin [Caballeronia sp. LZ032]